MIRPRAVAATLLFACGAVWLLGGCGGAPRDPEAGVSSPIYAAVPEARRARQTPEELAFRGEAIYRREHCDRCHTRFEAPPDDGPFDLPRPLAQPPGASRVGPDLGREGHRRSDDWHYAHLYAPDILVPGSRMPASRHLFAPAAEGPPRPTPEAEALVAWLQSLGRDRRDVWAEFRATEPSIPPPAAGDEAAARRRERAAPLYAEHCAACHGAAGDGRGPAAGLLAWPPRDLVRGVFRFRSVPLGQRPPDRDLFRTITLGTGTGAAMPSFAFLSVEDRWALVGAVRAFAGDAGDAQSPSAMAQQAEPSPPRSAHAAADATEAGQVADGARWFASWGCAACHGEGAAGRAAPVAETESGPAWRDESGRPIPSTGDLRHLCRWRGGASSEAFERALRHGVGLVMPSFAAALDREPGAAAAIRSYLMSLDPERAATPSAPAPRAITAPAGSAGASPAPGTTGTPGSR